MPERAAIEQALDVLVGLERCFLKAVTAGDGGVRGL